VRKCVSDMGGVRGTVTDNATISRRGTGQASGSKAEELMKLERKREREKESHSIKF